MHPVRIRDREGHVNVAPKESFHGSLGKAVDRNTGMG